MAVTKSLGLHSNTFESSHDTSIDEACIRNIESDLVFCGLLHSAAEATNRGYVCRAILLRRYPEALQLVKKFIARTAPSDRLTGKSGLGITVPDNVLLWQLEKQNNQICTEAVSVHTKKNMKDKGTATLFSSLAFYFYATALSKKM